MTFRLLSCDGGGIRGYLSSKLIQALDKATGGKLLSGVHGFAGTSTGGLISVSLASGVDIATVVDIYATKAAEIFTPNRNWAATEKDEKAIQAALEDKGLEAGPGYLGCAYTSAGLVSVMTPYLGTKTLGEIGGKLLAVNSAQLWNAAISPAHWAPVTLNNKGVGADYGSVTLLDAALATSAAPTYFPPHQIAGLGYFADGGTFANDPVLNGMEVAIASGAASALGDIEIVSIGTGISPQGIPASDIGNPLNWGVLKWLKPWASGGAPATPLLNLTLDLASQNLGAITERLLGKQLVRINPVLSKPVALDEYSPQDYRIMDEAIAAAMKSQDWKDALRLVSGW